MTEQEFDNLIETVATADLALTDLTAETVALRGAAEELTAQVNVLQWVCIASLGFSFALLLGMVLAILL